MNKITAYKAYLNIIKKTGILIKDLNIYDPFTTSLVFEYLLWNGFFSKNQQLKYDQNCQIYEPFLFGANIMLGKSVCLQNSTMLADLLTSLNYQSGLVIGYLNIDKNIPLSYTFPIRNQRTLLNSNVSNNFKVSPKLTYIDLKKKITQYFIGDHAITAFKFKDYYFLIDPTNNVFFYHYKPFKIKDLSGSLTMNIKVQSNFNFNSECEHWNNQELELLHQFLSYENDNNYWNISKEDIKELNTSCLYFCYAKEEIFKDFHQTLTEDIETIWEEYHLKKTK